MLRVIIKELYIKNMFKFITYQLEGKEYFRKNINCDYHI